LKNSSKKQIMEQIINKKTEILKSDLFELINKVEDKNILLAIYTILSPYRVTEQQDFWNDIPQELKQEIKDAKQEVREGKIKSHENIMQKYKL